MASLGLESSTSKLGGLVVMVAIKYSFRWQWMLYMGGFGQEYITGYDEWYNELKIIMYSEFIIERLIFIINIVSRWKAWK